MILPFNGMRLVNHSILKDFENSDAELLNVLKNSGLLQVDESPHYYIYQVDNNYSSALGLVALIQTENFHYKKILAHEDVYQVKQVNYREYFKDDFIQINPILLFHDNTELDAILLSYTDSVADMCHVDKNNISHRVWLISQEGMIDKLNKIYSRINTVYIADGHHRISVCLNLNLSVCMVFLASKTQINLKGFYRVIKDYNGLSQLEFMDKLEDLFHMEECASPGHTLNDNEYRMYAANRWYSLVIRQDHLKVNHYDRLVSANFLQNNLFAPVLNIKNQATSKRMKSVPSVNGFAAVQTLVNDQHFVAGFCYPPPTMDQLLASANDGILLPPNSTWIEPKLASGLICAALYK